MARRMQQEQFDLALLLTNSLRTAFVAWLGNAKQRIGYTYFGRGLLLTDKLYPRRKGRGLLPYPVVKSYLELAEAAGCGDESPQLELATVAADEQSANKVFKQLELRTDGRVIALNSSGAYGAAKLWPVEYFGHLAQRIVNELNHDVLVFCGPKERDIARQIVNLADRLRVVSMADAPMDLGTAKACIRRCRLMVSTDSGPRHVAAAFGLPVVTMYGPILPAWSENPTQKAINLILDLDCIGCHKRTCPYGHHLCMRDLTADKVFDAVVKLLSKAT